MKKKTFIFMVLYIFEVLVFALGMCMCLISEWDTFIAGVVATAIGALGLIVTGISDFISRGTKIKLPAAKTVGKVLLGISGVLVLGLGMCMTMVWSGMMVQGIVVGIIGIMLLVCLIPAIKGLK